MSGKPPRDSLKTCPGQRTHLTHCKEAVEDLEAARGMMVPQPPAARRAAPSEPPPLPHPPSGLSIVASAPDGPPTSLVGSKILYW